MPWAHLAELGMAAAQGREGVKELLAIVAQDGDSRLPVDAHASLIVLAAQLQAVQTMIRSIEKRIITQHRSKRGEQAVKTIPGIGVIGATAIAATVPDPKVFRSGRDFAAWIGLGARDKIDRRQAEAWADLETGRSLFASHPGGRSLRGVEQARQQPEKYRWLTQLLARRPFKVVAVALANKCRGSPGRCWLWVGPTGTPPNGGLTRNSAIRG